MLNCRLEKCHSIHIVKLGLKSTLLSYIEKSKHIHHGTLITYLQLGVVHILRNQPRGGGFPNAYGRLRGGGGGWSLITKSKFSFFTNFRNTNWTIFVDFVIKIFIFTNFEKKFGL